MACEKLVDDQLRPSHLQVTDAAKSGRKQEDQDIQVDADKEALACKHGQANKQVRDEQKASISSRQPQSPSTSLPVQDTSADFDTQPPIASTRNTLNHSSVKQQRQAFHGGLCKFWVNEGRCWKGAACMYAHPSKEGMKAARTAWVEGEQVRRRQARGQAGDPHAHSSSQKAERATILAHWLVSTFGRSYLNSGSGVLDIAGGRGEITFELQESHGVRSVLVEPRLWTPWKLGKARRARLKHSGTTVASFTLPRLQYALGAEAHPEELRSAIEQCSVLVGMHPDEATEPILIAALKHHKPFCIVPCCVFKQANPQRRVVDSDGCAREVATYEDLVAYLVQRGAGETAQLPFEGRNIAVFSRPCRSA